MLFGACRSSPCGQHSDCAIWWVIAQAKAIFISVRYVTFSWNALLSLADEVRRRGRRGRNWNLGGRTNTRAGGICTHRNSARSMNPLRTWLAIVRL